MAKSNTRTESSGGDAPFEVRLRRLREAAGLTQEELAARAGLSAKAISLLERGARSRPYPHTVRSLADALDLHARERARLLGAVSGRNGGASPAEGAVQGPSCRRPSPRCWGGSAKSRSSAACSGGLTSGC